MDTNSTVYYIKINGFAAGFVRYGSGEFYSDEFDFSTNSKYQSQSVRQLGRWMEEMEGKGYQFVSVEEEIDNL